MLVRKAYRFRIYPTPEQATLFRRTAGCCRLVHNLCLDQKVLERHRSEPRRLNAFDQQKELGALKAELPFLREVPHHALQQAIVDLHRAFENFFEGRTAFPTFRRKGDRDAFRFPDPKQFRIDAEGDPGKKRKGRLCRVFLPKAGWVGMLRHREIVGRIKSATVSREADRWFVSFQTEREAAEAPPNGLPAVGIDGGVAQPLVMSDGTVVMLPRVTAAERRRKAALQRKLARQVKGSRNREKTRRAIARIDAAWARRRRDAAEKESTHRTKNHGLIAIEDLPLRNMTRSAKGTAEEPGTNVRAKSGLNRSLLDVGLGAVYAMYERKSAANGCRVMRVDPRHTSQGCGECGHVAAENRPTRAAFCCVACGHEDCADRNAAGNVLDRGLAAVAADHAPPLAA